MLFFDGQKKITNTIPRITSALYAVRFLIYATNWFDDNIKIVYDCTMESIIHVNHINEGNGFSDPAGQTLRCHISIDKMVTQGVKKKK